MSVAIKRVYDPASRADGKRILVDRVWPRGVKKSEARVDEWLKDIAPSTELRKWFAHDADKWAEFQKRYAAELKNSTALSDLRKAAKDGPVTLVFAARDEEHNNAAALKRMLERSG